MASDVHGVYALDRTHVELFRAIRAHVAEDRWNADRLQTRFPDAPPVLIAAAIRIAKASLSTGVPDLLSAGCSGGSQQATLSLCVVVGYGPDVNVGQIHPGLVMCWAGTQNGMPVLVPAATTAQWPASHAELDAWKAHQDLLCRTSARVEQGKDGRSWSRRASLCLDGGTHLMLHVELPRHQTSNSTTQSVYVVQVDGVYLCLPAANGKCLLRHILRREQWRCCLMLKTGMENAAGNHHGRYNTCFDLGMCLPAGGTPLSPPMRSALYMQVLDADMSEVRDIRDVVAENADNAARVAEVRRIAAEQRRAAVALEAARAVAALEAERAALEAERAAARAAARAPDNPAASEEASELLRLMFAMPDDIPWDNERGYPGLLELTADATITQEDKEERMRHYPNLGPEASVPPRAGSGMKRSYARVWDGDT